MNRLSGLGTSRRHQAEFGHAGKEIVRAIVVVTFDTEERVAIAVAGGDQRVVDAARGVFDQGQDRPPLVGPQHVAGLRNQMQAVGAGMLVRHELAQVDPVEGPGIDDLFAMGIDDGDDLTRCDEGGLAAPRGNFNQVVHRSPHGLNAIKSISTMPPRARSVTPTVVRPGRRPSVK